tara:strand:+ start:16 stop:288 length:273 start_codon:yes stop_codon:yes gene_type:complete
MANLTKYQTKEVLNKVLNSDGELKCNNTVTQLSNVTVEDTGAIATIKADIATIKADIATMQDDIAIIKATTTKLDACIDTSANKLNVSTS